MKLTAVAKRTFTDSPHRFGFIPKCKTNHKIATVTCPILTVQQAYCVKLLCPSPFNLSFPKKNTMSLSSYGLLAGSISPMAYFGSQQFGHDESVKVFGDRSPFEHR